MASNLFRSRMPLATSLVPSDHDSCCKWDGMLDLSSVAVSQVQSLSACAAMESTAVQNRDVSESLLGQRIPLSFFALLEAVFSL